MHPSDSSREPPATPGSDLPPDSPAEPLRILIVSTPKSGNTWLKLLLGEAYNVPMVDLPDNPRDIDLTTLPESWVAQQHYWFEAGTREWLEKNGVVVLTTVRHPGDVFVSLWHHVKRAGRPAVNDARHSGFLQLDGPAMGEAAEAFARQGFYRDLHVSISWLRAGESLCVRYEDLWSRPFETLQAVTSFVRACTSLDLQRAISLCQIRRLQRSNLDQGRGFFRQGGIGGWRHALPENIAAILREADPYPSQFAFLGYTMNPAQYGLEPPPADYSADPFRGAERFANGVPIVPVLLRAYFAHAERFAEKWGDPVQTPPGGFFDWLTAPAAADPTPGAVPLVTELAAYLWTLRADVRRVFPAPFTTDRLAFTNWFTANAATEYQLDHHLVLPVFRSWASPAATGEAAADSPVRSVGHGGDVAVR